VPGAWDKAVSSRCGPWLHLHSASVLAEVPGLAWAAAVVDCLGRKRSQAAAMALVAVFTLPLVPLASGAGSTALLFGGRVCASPPPSPAVVQLCAAASASAARLPTLDGPSGSHCRPVGSLMAHLSPAHLTRDT
jgi:hypothetical protein